MPTFDVDGAPIHVEVSGAEGAPAIVLSNSLGTNLHMWDEQQKTLAGKLRVIRYDQRGHGKSGTSKGPYSIERLARDVLAILDRLQIPRAHFCGLSMGGMTGMWLGRYAPERIDRLVLANCTPKSQTPENWNARIQTVLAKGVEAVADAVLNAWLSKDFRERAPQTASRMRAMMVATDAQGYANCCAAIRDMDQRWGIAEIKNPTLIIAGRHDPAATPKDGEFMAGRIAASKMEVLDAAHISSVENPSAFNAALDKFLKG